MIRTTFLAAAVLAGLTFSGPAALAGTSQAVRPAVAAVPAAACSSIGCQGVLCPPGHTCVYAPKQCFTLPCPQYDCVPVGAMPTVYGTTWQYHVGGWPYYGIGWPTYGTAWSTYGSTWPHPRPRPISEVPGPAQPVSSVPAPRPPGPGQSTGQQASQGSAPSGPISQAPGRPAPK